MREDADPPEITPACWGILNVSPDSVMCSSARMVVRRRGSERPVVVACTLLAYDQRFELGATLADANKPVHLAHPHPCPSTGIWHSVAGRIFIFSHVTSSAKVPKSASTGPLTLSVLPALPVRELLPLEQIPIEFTHNLRA